MNLPILQAKPLAEKNKLYVIYEKALQLIKWLNTMTLCGQRGFDILEHNGNGEDYFPLIQAYQ